MNIAIIEDEKPAAAMLEMLIKQIEPTTQILATIPSVAKSIDWLKSKKVEEEYGKIFLRLLAIAAVIWGI